MSSAYDHLSYAGFDLSNDITSTSFAQTASVNSDRVGLLSAPKSRISIVRDERDLGPIRFDDPPGPRKFALNLRSGWRVGAALASLGALITLIVNIAIGAWASSRKGLNSVGVLVELFRGDCDTAARLNTWSHLAINIVSTLLLAGSNYCMQCLVAPSRSDINRAHARGAWLDIGVPSLRNLGWIGWWRKSLWIILIISSLPLHLMFNSVFFTSIATHNYNVVFVTPNFTQGAPFSTASGRNTGAFQPPIWKENLTTVQQLVQDNRFERLENAECINAYAVDLQTSRRTLVVVSSNASIHDTGSIIGSGHQDYVLPERWSTLQQGYNPYDWMCGTREVSLHGVKFDRSGNLPKCYTYVKRFQPIPGEWWPSDWHADHCLSEKVDGQCSFNVNLAIIWIVVACNVIKFFTMTIVAYSGTIDRPLMTIGDAIASFMTIPDSTTKNMCLTSREEIVKRHREYRRWKTHNPGRPRSEYPDYPDIWKADEAQRWQYSTSTWANAASSGRWTWATIFYLACMGATIGLLGRAIGFYQGDKSASSLAALGFGHPNSQTMINGWAVSSLSNKATAIVLSVLIANLPQLILSLLYFSINGLCTSMSLANEWSQLSVSSALKSRAGAKTLRCSNPEGQQRATYFLQLPFRFAVPLISVAAIIHWLISQSIFLGVVTIYDEVGNLQENFAVATCGFSPLAMILVIMSGAFLGLGIVGLSRLKLNEGMRIVGSCSAAISAACHPEVAGTKQAEDGWQTVKGPVVWGDVSMATIFKPDMEDDSTGHCCFVGAADSGWQMKVRQPIEGKPYS